MAVYSVKNKRQSWYGESIGILILNAAYPCVPGNVGNASTYPFPVRYKEIKEATIERFFYEKDDELIKFFIEGAIELQDEGVKAITGACGFMARFQQPVADALDIPVLLTSLLQIPFIHTITQKKVGIITADASRLTSDYFESIGINNDIPITIVGMEDQKNFREGVLEESGILDSEGIKQEVTNVAKTLIANDKEIGAILLECSDLPPYAAAIQREINLPVFDFNTMIEYVHTAIVRKDYHGFM